MTSCNAELLKLHAAGGWSVDSAQTGLLEKSRCAELRRACKDGSTHVRADLPASRGRPSVLKGQRTVATLGILRRKITRKTSYAELVRNFSAPVPLIKVALPPRYMGASTSFSFGKDVPATLPDSLVQPTVTFGRPFKIRRVSVKTSCPVSTLAGMVGSA